MLNNLCRRGGRLSAVRPLPSQVQYELRSVGFCQSLNGLDRTLQPARYLKHVAHFERVLAGGINPCQPAESGLLDALNFQPLPQWKAELTVAGFQPKVPVITRLSCWDLETDLKAFARIKEGDTGP